MKQIRFLILICLICGNPWLNFPGRFLCVLATLRLGSSSVLTRHTLLDKSRNRGRVRALTLQLLPHSLIHKCGALNNLNASNLIAQWLDKTTNECLLLVIDLLAGTFLSRGES